MRVLITGASGLLGGYLSKAQPDDPSIEVLGTHKCHLTEPTWSSYLDLEYLDKILPFIGGCNPDVIVHTAGMGSVDEAQRDATRAHLINCQATIQIACAARQRNARLIYISSNAIYGIDSLPCDESSTPCPVNVYGAIKLVTEYCLQAERRHDLEVDIIRPILLYGWPQKGGRGNWVTNCLEKFSRGERVEAVQDVITQPLYAYDLAQFLWKLIVQGIRGDYNIAGGTSCNYVEFSLEIARAFGYDENLVEPINSSDLPNLAPRPKACYYDMTRAYGVGYHPRKLKEGLEKMWNDNAAKETFGGYK